MALTDIWDYVRASGDRRLRKQGYVSSGMGILDRYRRVPRFWAPHLENNRQNLLNISLDPKFGSETGGTLLILGAGRMLDVPWEQLFPRFERVVLADADHCVVPYVERLLAASKVQGIKTPLFEIGDLTASVVDVAAWAESVIAGSSSGSVAAKALRDGFESAVAPQAPWVRMYADVRLAVSTNLLSQLGYYPRLHIQTEFQKRFKQQFDSHEEAAESLERYFVRVRARHIQDLCSLHKSWGYLATDIDVVTYELKAKHTDMLTAIPPPNAGVELNSRGEVQFFWPAKIIEHSDPLHGQHVKDLWPRGTVTAPPKRWVWHIVPQGSEKKYPDFGRVHIVEAWTKQVTSG